jgi:hypothetical protein
MIHILHDTIDYDATRLERDDMDYAFHNYHFNRIIRRIILRLAFAHGYRYLEFTHRYGSSLMSIKFVNHLLNKILTIVCL